MARLSLAALNIIKITLKVQGLNRNKSMLFCNLDPEHIERQTSNRFQPL